MAFYKNIVYAILCAGLIVFFFLLWRQPGSEVRSELHVTSNQTPPTAEVKISKPSPALMAEPVTYSVTPRDQTLKVQISLARLGFSPGSIDGTTGAQTESAVRAWQRSRGLAETDSSDSNTLAQLAFPTNALTNYVINETDVSSLAPLPHTWLGKSQVATLGYETMPELLGEKSFSSPTLIRKLNPEINWENVAIGTTVILPNVSYPASTNKAAFLRIHLDRNVLEAFDDASNLLVHFPCSIGRIAAKRPVGELHVATIATDPNYTFDPAVFPESPEAQAIGHKLIISPGPNNPVGVAWIGLDRPGYGIHGTPAPEQVGRTESHGCFRLANWNAAYLVQLVWIGLPVWVE